MSGRLSYIRRLDGKLFFEDEVVMEDNILKVRLTMKYYLFSWEEVAVLGKIF